MGDRSRWQLLHDTNVVLSAYNCMSGLAHSTIRGGNLSACKRGPTCACAGWKAALQTGGYTMLIGGTSRATCVIDVSVSGS